MSLFQNQVVTGLFSYMVGNCIRDFRSGFSEVWQGKQGSIKLNALFLVTQKLKNDKCILCGD